MNVEVDAFSIQHTQKFTGIEFNKRVPLDCVIWNVKCGCQEGKETLGNELTWKMVEAMGFTCIHHTIQI